MTPPGREPPEPSGHRGLQLAREDPAHLEAADSFGDRAMRRCRGHGCLTSVSDRATRARSAGSHRSGSAVRRPVATASRSSWWSRSFWSAYAAGELGDGLVEDVGAAEVGGDGDRVAGPGVGAGQRLPAGLPVDPHAVRDQRFDVDGVFPVPQLADVKVALLAVQPGLGPLPANPAAGPHAAPAPHAPPETADPAPTPADTGGSSGVQPRRQHTHHRLLSIHVEPGRRSLHVWPPFIARLHSASWPVTTYRPISPRWKRREGVLGPSAGPVSAVAGIRMSAMRSQAGPLARDGSPFPAWPKAAA